MTAISVGYVVCLIPLVLVLYRMPRVSHAEDVGTASASGDVARPPGIRALMSMGQGFGLGFAVRTAPSVDALLPSGEYRWDGVGGTFFFIDPKDDMFTIVMLQSPSQRGRIETEVKQLVYEALGK